MENMCYKKIKTYAARVVQKDLDIGKNSVIVEKLTGVCGNNNIIITNNGNYYYYCLLF